MSAPIFISYSSKDRDMAETICRALEARGHTCWISCRDVYPGQNFQEAIVQALRSAQVMLLVFTSNANNSDEIKKELVLAGRHRVTVVPIRVEDVVPNDAFAYEFATRQWIDLFSDWEKEIERLAVRIGQILQTGKPPDDAGAEAATFAGARRRIGATRRSGPAIVAATSALVAVLLVIGAAVLYLRPFARAPSAASPAPQQTAAATPAAAPSPSPQPAASPAKPEPPAPPPASGLHRHHHHPQVYGAADTRRQPRRRRRLSRPQRRQPARRRRQHPVPMELRGRRRRRRTRLPRSTTI